MGREGKPPQLGKQPAAGWTCPPRTPGPNVASRFASWPLHQAWCPCALHWSKGGAGCDGLRKGASPPTPRALWGVGNQLTLPLWETVTRGSPQAGGAKPTRSRLGPQALGMASAPLLQRVTRARETPGPAPRPAGREASAQPARPLRGSHHSPLLRNAAPPAPATQKPGWVPVSGGQGASCSGCRACAWLQCQTQPGRQAAAPGLAGLCQAGRKGALGFTCTCFQQWDPSQGFLGVRRLGSPATRGQGRALGEGAVQATSLPKSGGGLAGNPGRSGTTEIQFAKTGRKSERS